MNIQEKLLFASAELRTRAAALATAARNAAQDRTRLIGVLDGARREFSNVTRRHAERFVKQNSALARAVRKDVSQLARATYASLAVRPASRPATRKTRRPTSTRRGSAKTA